MNDETCESKADTALIFGCVLSLGMLVSVAYHYVLAVQMGQLYPRSTFLFDPKRWGLDYFQILSVFRGPGVYSPEGSSYFPFAHIPLYALNLISAKAGYWVLCTMLLGAVFALIFFAARGLPTLWRVQLAGLFALSYPVWFCIDRGNLEVFVFLAILAAGAAYIHRAYALAGVCVGLAAAMKGYPAAFALVFIAERRWRAFAAAVAATWIGVLVPLFLFPGGFFVNVAGLWRNLGEYQGYFLGTHAGVRFGCSLFSLFRLRTLEEMPSSSLLAGYHAVVFAIGVVMTLWAYRRQPPMQFLVPVLTVYFLVFPPVSNDYKLIHLFFAAALLLLYPEVYPPKVRRWLGCLLALILLPKAYTWVGEETSVAVVLNPLLLLWLGARFLAAAPAPRQATPGRF